MLKSVGIHFIIFYLTSVLIEMKKHAFPHILAKNKFFAYNIIDIMGK